MKNKRMRLASAVLALAMLLGTLPVTAAAEEGEQAPEAVAVSEMAETAAYMDLYDANNWVADRTEPESFQIENGEITFRVSEQPGAESWYGWQGRKAYTNAPVTAYWKVSYTMDVTETMMSQDHVNASVWIQVDQEGTNGAASQKDCVDWAIVQYINAAEVDGKWQSWDSKGSGAWKDIDAVTAEVDSYTIDVVFDNGRLTQYINGTEVNSYDIGVTKTKPAALIAQGRSYGAAFDVKIGVPQVFSTVEIADNADLAEAIKNQQDGQTWNIAAGTYTLTQEDLNQYSGWKNPGSSSQGGWYFPLYANDLTLVGTGDVEITSDVETANGAWATQDFVSVWGNHVTIDNVDFLSKSYQNKVIEVMGQDFTLKNAEMKKVNEWGSGSITFNSQVNNGDIGTATLENVKLYAWVSTNYSKTGTLIAENVTIDFTENSYAGYYNDQYGYGWCPGIFNNNSNVTVYNQNMTIIVDDAINLPGQIFNGKMQENTTVVLTAGEYDVTKNGETNTAAVGSGAYIDTPNVTIKGEGRALIQAQTNGSNWYHDGIAQMNTVTVAADHVTLDGLTFRPIEMLNDGNSLYPKALEVTSAATTFTLRNCTFEAMEMSDTLHVSYGGTQAEYFGTWYGGQISINTSKDSDESTVLVENNQFHYAVLDPRAPITAQNNTFDHVSKAHNMAIRSRFQTDGAANTIAHTGSVIHNNKFLNITGEEIAVYAGTDGTKAVELDATHNYWGSANPDFTTLVSGNVTTDPYYKAETMNPEDLSNYVPSTDGGSSSGSGNQTETTTNPDGSTTTTVTKPDGSTTETTKTPDGASSVVNTDKNGQIEAEVKLPETVVSDAADKGETVSLPMPEVPVTTDKETAPTVTVNLPANTTAKVEIPVENVTAGTVAILVKADGTEEIIKTSVATENGLAVALSDGDTVKIVDNSQNFADVTDGYWGSDAVAFATSRELFNGTGETTFSPEGDMTRAMIVTVLARYEGVDTTGGNTWYEQSVEWAQESGISDGTDLNGSVTREQLAAMLYRYAGSPAVSGEINGFADSGSVSDWASDAMAWAVQNGIISGSNGKLDAQGTATRAQVATILMRFVAMEF